MFDYLRAAIRSAKDHDPAARNSFEILLLYPGIHAIINHRIAHFFYTHKCYFIARMISQVSRFFTQIEIHPGAKIGKGLFIDHGSGVVIGETTEIGDYCTIYQGVTLGGTGKDKGKRHPTLGNYVMVGSGARVLGPFKVGDHARIAANAVVLHEVPEYSTCVGVPGRVVRIKGEKIVENQIPDPVAQELCRLHVRLDQLEKKLQERGDSHESL